ncbi:hypothetical protein GCM10009677_60760 [Sphaerisporangium rubeum]
MAERDQFAAEVAQVDALAAAGGLAAVRQQRDAQGVVLISGEVMPVLRNLHGHPFRAGALSTSKQGMYRKSRS